MSGENAEPRMKTCCATGERWSKTDLALEGKEWEIRSDKEEKKSAVEREAKSDGVAVWGRRGGENWGVKD